MADTWDNPKNKIEEAPMDQTCHEKMQEAVDAYIADFDKHRAAGNIPEDAKHCKNTMVVYSLIFNALSAAGRSLGDLHFIQVANGINDAYDDQILASEQKAMN